VNEHRHRFAIARSQVERRFDLFRTSLSDEGREHGKGGRKEEPEVTRVCPTRREAQEARVSGAIDSIGAVRVGFLTASEYCLHIPAHKVLEVPAIWQDGAVVDEGVPQQFVRPVTRAGADKRIGRRMVDPCAPERSIAV
jgi:hypothetical protein